MQVPLEVRYDDDVERTPKIESIISERAGKLEHFCDHITSCRVAVERPHHAASSGSRYRVRLDVTVPPGHELIVDKGPANVPFDEKLDTTIIEAFKAMERQLKELNERQQGEVKRHERNSGFVVRLFQDRGYGFLKAADEDREVFFAKSAVAEDDFDRLEVGTQVRYVAQKGEKGPQASTVQIIDKPGHRVSPDEPVPVPPGWKKQ